MNIVQAILDNKARKAQRWPCKANRASSIGYFVPELEGCLRRGVYERTNWQDKELPDGRLQLIFDEGRNQEEIVMRDMAAAGVQLLEQQGAFEWAKYEITGHLDGVIIEDGKAIPVEIKSMSPYSFASTQTFEDMKKKPWTRSYMAQIQIYMLSKNIDKAIFVCKNKSTGELRQIDCVLDYELAEACLKTAEAINGHIKAGTLPDKIVDMEKCKDCPFKTLCQPEINFGEPLKIADDPAYEKELDRREALAEASDEYKKVDEIVKDRAKATAGQGDLNIMVGKYHLTGKRDKKGSFRLTIDKGSAGEEA